MTEAEWRACANPKIMQEFFRGGLSPRKLRLFAVESIRPFWHLLIDPRSREAVILAEQVAEHPELSELLRPAHRQAWDAVPQLSSDRGDHVIAAHAAGRTVESDPVQASCLAWNAISGLYADIREEQGTSEAERYALHFKGKAEGERFLSELVRDIFGNPFRLVSFDPSWLTSDVVALATGIYHDRAFDRLPILADALQDAGCGNDDILTHLRGPGPHVLGCWVIDLVLGKS
jgi:hypothetical protein